MPSPLLALRDGIVMGNSHGTVTCVDQRGAVRWQVARGASTSAELAGDPAIGIVVAVSHNTYGMTDTVLVLDPATGRQRSAAAVQDLRIVQGPAIIGGAIIVGCARPEPDGVRQQWLVSTSPAGAINWKSRLLLAPHGIAGDEVGNIYVGCSGTGTQADGGAVESFDKAGTRRWQATFRSGVAASPVVTSTWVYFVTRNNGRTGLYTYSREGAFQNFVSVDLVPDVLARMMVSTNGELTLAALDTPALLMAD